MVTGTCELDHRALEKEIYWLFLSFPELKEVWSGKRGKIYTKMKANTQEKVQMWRLLIPSPRELREEGKKVPPGECCYLLYFLTGSEGSNAFLLQQTSPLALIITTLCTTSDKDMGGNLSEPEDQRGSECTFGSPPLWADNQNITSVVPIERVNTTNITTTTSQRYTLTSFTSRGGEFRQIKNMLKNPKCNSNLSIDSLLADWEGCILNTLVPLCNNRFKIFFFIPCTPPTTWRKWQGMWRVSQAKQL